MSYIMINGTKLASKLHESGKTQKELADSMGTSRYQVCRWCAKGSHSLVATSAKRMCDVLNIPLSDILEGYEVEQKSVVKDINDQEMAILRAFRAMSPVEKAKLVLTLLDKDSTRFAT